MQASSWRPRREGSLQLKPHEFELDASADRAGNARVAELHTKKTASHLTNVPVGAYNATVLLRFRLDSDVVGRYFRDFAFKPVGKTTCFVDQKFFGFILVYFFVSELK